MHPKGDFLLLGNKTLIIKDKLILKRGVDNDIINPLKNNKVNKQF
jgi:hypothetical protein